MNRLLIASGRDVRELLPIGECIDAMERAFAALGRGEALNPLRTLVRPAGEGFLGLMPAWLGGSERSVFGIKEVCVFPGNPARGLHTHLGSVLLHSGETGELMAVIDASAVTAIRTAAVSALATKLLANTAPEVIAIIGTGTQAWHHAEAFRYLYPGAELRIAGREEGRSAELADRIRSQWGGDVAHMSAEEAVAGADVVTTVTASREPVIFRRWLKAGAHVNLVGACVRTAREADSATIADSLFFVDRIESTLAESGDYLKALEDGSVGHGHIRGELAELVLGRTTGRNNETELTVFKSLGLAVEDLVAGTVVYDRAVAMGRGSWVDFG